MVKAGIFLLTLLWPVLAGTDSWYLIVTTTGLATLLVVAWAAIFQQDLKGLLAYSTISHLGLITLLLGLGSPLAAVAAIFHTVNHATFKASLFMARSEEHTSELQSLMRISYAVFCLKKTQQQQCKKQYRDTCAHLTNTHKAPYKPERK